MQQAILKTGLTGLYMTGLPRILHPLLGGVGIIVMLHRVRPARADSFQPNRSLEVTPAFLESAIGWLKKSGYEFVTLDAACDRLADGRSGSRFATFTLDDGYKDNLIWAKPVFNRHGVPYTVYVPGSFAEGRGDLWWLTVEAIVAAQDAVDLGDRIIPSATVQEKHAAYGRLRDHIFACPGRSEEIAFVRGLAERHGHDSLGAVRRECMDWNELLALAADPLAAIGAHTMSHLMLAKAAEGEARRELIDGRRILEEQLGREVRHLAYPYGNRQSVGEREFRMAAEAGYRSAVTTRPGVLTAGDGKRMTALPRVNLDGRLQGARCLDVMFSGLGPACLRLIWRFV